jgi:glycosyltransferase involved in cell wall biosynthesis
MIYRAIKRADAYIALSTFERDYLIDSWQVPREKIVVIGVGIDPERFEQADGASIRERYSIGDRPLVAFIGQQGHHKGIASLIPAMKVVWHERPETRLLIAGARTQFTPVFEHLVRTQLSHNEQDRIVYMHSFAENEKPSLFAACDVFAYPSWYESFGIAFLEAWAAGKPVVGCRSGAVPTVVDDGVDGILVPPRDPVTLGIALLRLLDSRELRRRLGRAGRKKLLQRYQWAAVTKSWRGLYERVLNECKR